MSFVLGLTGPTGAGKGVFSSCAKELGFNVIDCDIVARRAHASIRVVVGQTASIGSARVPAAIWIKTAAPTRSVSVALCPQWVTKSQANLRNKEYELFNRNIES